MSAGDVFNLDTFAPAKTRFTVKGIDYVVDGDPDVDVVARMLSIEERVRATSRRAELVPILQEARDLVLEMVKREDPAVVELPIGSQEIMLLLARIMHGEDVANTVANALLRPGALDEQADDTRTPEEIAAALEVDGEDGPLSLSASSSSRQSSTSGDGTDGDPATGTG